jgi:hypothetical protein
MVRMKPWRRADRSKGLCTGRQWRDNVRFQLETTLSRGRGTAVNHCPPCYAGKNKRLLFGARHVSREL